MYENELTQAFCFPCAEVLELRVEGHRRFFACPGCGKRLE
jgi:predicted RNA-binding Zn-ribbon protein involved in translation (DUF1610 family)